MKSCIHIVWNRQSRHLCAIICINISETLYLDDIDDKCIAYEIKLPIYGKEEIRPNYYTHPKNGQCLLKFL